jgi:hypothetical protein
VIAIKKSNIINAGLFLAGCLAIWHAGWLLYDYQRLWQAYTTEQFQNILGLALVGFAITYSVVLRWKGLIKPVTPAQMASANVPVRLEAPSSSPADLEKLRNQVAEILEKVTDIHAVMHVMGEAERKKEA